MLCGHMAFRVEMAFAMMKSSYAGREKRPPQNVNGKLCGHSAGSCTNAGTAPLQECRVIRHALLMVQRDLNRDATFDA